MSSITTVFDKINPSTEDIPKIDPLTNVSVISTSFIPSTSAGFQNFPLLDINGNQIQFSSKNVILSIFIRSRAYFDANGETIEIYLASSPGSSPVTTVNIVTQPYQDSRIESGYLTSINSDDGALNPPRIDPELALVGNYPYLIASQSGSFQSTTKINLVITYMTIG